MGIVIDEQLIEIWLKLHSLKLGMVTDEQRLGGGWLQMSSTGGLVTDEQRWRRMRREGSCI